MNIMRVTKLISEYVEKTVAAKLPYGEPTKANCEACTKMKTLQQQINAKVAEYATQLCEEANKQLPEGFILGLYGHSFISKTNLKAPLQEAANKHESETREQRAKAVESILVELELGATKADLERLIAEAINK